MAVAFRSLATLAYGSRTNSTVPAPSGVTNGDILLMGYLIGGGSPPTPTLPSGWTVIQGPSTVSDSSFLVARRLLWKVASSEPANYTFTHTTGSTCAVIVAVSGGNTGATPVSSNNGRSFGDAAPANVTTALSVTTPAADSYVAFIVHNWNLYGTGVPPTGTTPTFTERLDAGDNLWYVADGVLSGGSAATGDKSHNNLAVSSTAGDGWGAFLVAIGPSGAAPSAFPAHNYHMMMQA